MESFLLCRLGMHDPRRLIALASWTMFATSCAATPDEIATNEPRPPTSGAEAGTPEDTPPVPPPAADAGPSEPESDAGPGMPLPKLVPAGRLAISEIALFQGVKVPIMKAGAEHDPSGTVHPVAGREGFLRIYVEPEADFVPTTITARLRLVRPGAAPLELEATRWVKDASEESDLDSTLNVAFPAGALDTDTSYSVELLCEPDATKGATGAARFPSAGEVPLHAWNTGGVFKVKLVPVKNAGRLPETGPEQLELYRQELQAMFPVRKVELTLREPWEYPGTVYAGGSGIASLLTAVTNLRQKDDAPDDVYYYGAFRATDTYSGYCAGGCTTGICHLVYSSTDSYSRACVGVGYKGASAAGTMAHELGHAHGLPHAPCGNVAGPDSSYPYSGAKIGAWGWDLRDDSLIEPGTRDFMSYCSPSWISDYNFDRLIHRMKKVAEQEPSEVSAGGSQAAEWQSAEVRPDGSLVFGEVVRLRRAPDAEPRVVVLERGGKDVATSTAHFYPLADRAGGTLLVPHSVVPWDAVRVANLAGRTVRATR